MRIPRPRLIAGAVALVVGATGFMVLDTTRAGHRLEGLTDGETLGPARLESAAVRVRDAGPGVTARIDGAETTADPVIRLAGLADGPHELTVRVPGAWWTLGATTVHRRFFVDTRPPVLTVPDQLTLTSPREEPTLTGRVDGADTVTVDGVDTPVTDGAFAARVARGAGAVRVSAVDAAGNTTAREVPVVWSHPGMRAVHVGGPAWGRGPARDEVLRLIREKRIDTVQLDIKDESGVVLYDTAVPRAREIHAHTDHYDVRAAIRELHDLGVRVVGRLVVFRDPVYGAAAWRAGRRDELVQNAAGGPWTGHYGDFAFTNPAHPDVRRYNLELAREAAGLGFDDVLYDYIRRPDGPISSMRLPGLTGTPEQAVIDFLAESRAVLRPLGVYQGASVFGVAVRTPRAVAQDIPGMAAVTDYLAPMVYPSHWGPGEYGVANPDAQPYEIVKRSIADFRSVTGPTPVIPWLQDFSLGVTYGPSQVEAQIRGSADAGAPSFLLWNAASTYHRAALTPAG